MKTKSYQLLVNATGQLMQQHVFDHLSDEKLFRMNHCLRQLGNQNSGIASDGIEDELFKLFGEANLYTETTTPQSVHQWQAAMSCFGKTIMQTSALVEEVE
ncbi:MAG: hypothetical protein K2Q21_07380 [Chitinophagaceae bacterium]|nr:hypothetical protein [Chitinophagaceae bacterium]